MNEIDLSADWAEERAPEESWIAEQARLLDAEEGFDDAA